MNWDLIIALYLSTGIATELTNVVMAFYTKGWPDLSKAPGMREVQLLYPPLVYFCIAVGILLVLVLLAGYACIWPWTVGKAIYGHFTNGHARGSRSDGPPDSGEGTGPG
jgi:hypothetical protein